MLVASLNLLKFAQETQQKSMLAASELLLVDDKGTVMAWVGARAGLPRPGSSIAGDPVFALARSQPLGRSGTAVLSGADGQSQVWAVANSPVMQAAGLRLLLGQPREVLAAESALHLREGLWVVALAALLLFAGVWTLAEWGIRRQVGRIAHLARALGAGDLTARIAPPFPRGELGGLMSVFNRTADSLQQQREAIEELGQQLRDAHAREITEREQNEARLSQIANFDGLTGLPNRHLFRDRLHQAMARTQRSGRPFALMFLDIDRFKNINDSLGHEVGDQLLVEVSKVLLHCVRDTDSVAREGLEPAADGVFRLGGDEFTILAEDLFDRESVGGVAQRILDVLSRPFQVRGHELFISASIGITVYADDGTDLDGLIKQADIAMYRAKEAGRDTYTFFDEQLNRAVRQRHEMEAKLRHALERGEFLLHYQPKADMRSGRITGVEALLRWQPPGEAMVGPDQFIPILEETGLILTVGAWVIREACMQAMAWQRAGLRPLNLAVNLSARQFRQPDLVGHVAQVVADTGFDPALLEIELTESMLIDESEAVQGILMGLSAMRVGIAIDDFGTGQSSLRYLKRFHVDTLKIDRAFVKDLPDDAEDSAIAAAVIALGQGLGLKVVAEGVETERQLDFLRSRGCDELQGYWLSRPLAADAFARWWADHEADRHAIPAAPSPE